MPADAPRPHHPGLVLPDGWSVRERTAFGPFEIRAVLERPDGTTVEWTSRRHRKRLGLRPAVGAGPTTRRRPSTTSIVIGTLFAVGSLCFAVGVVPAYAEAVGPAADAWTFFVGSIFFTSAAVAQLREAATAPEGPDATSTTDRLPASWLRVLAWSPHRLDWWACAVQLVGTVLFNVSTFAATRQDLAVTADRRWIWAPDVAGSVCFLVASWLAYVEVSGTHPRLSERSPGWWIAALNLLGSVAFGVSAVAARYLPDTGAIADLPLANLGTFVGAVCFFAGAVLLPVESAVDAGET